MIRTWKRALRRSRRRWIHACIAALGFLACAQVVADDAVPQCSGAAGLSSTHRGMLDATGWLGFVRQYLGVVDYVPALPGGRPMAVSCATYVGTDRFASDCAVEIATEGRGHADIAADIVFGADVFAHRCRGTERPARSGFLDDLARHCGVHPDKDFCLAACQEPRFTAEEMLDAVNRVRSAGASCGSDDLPPAPPLVWNSTLETIAAGHAEDMARQDYFGHDSLDGRSGCDRVTDGGYRYRRCGENLAYGQQSVEDVVRGWLESPGHCRSLLSPVFEELGAAVATSVASRCSPRWVQTFGTPLE